LDEKREGNRGIGAFAVAAGKGFADFGSVHFGGGFFDVAFRRFQAAIRAIGPSKKAVIIDRFLQRYRGWTRAGIWALLDRLS